MRDSAPIAAGVFLLTALMVGIFALVGHYSPHVLWGAMAGALLSTANFFFMALSAGIATDKAVSQDVKGGQLVMQLSYGLRLAVIFVLLALGVKFLSFNPIAAILPVAFVRPAITVHSLFRKKGASSQ